MSETGDRTQPIEGQPDKDASPPAPPTSRASREGSQFDRTLPLPRPASGALPKVPGVDVTRKIGEGGMGVVYVGVQSFLGRQVAVKFLGPEHRDGAFAAHFHREARLLAEMKHTNIVACYQADFTPDGDCYLVMEYIDGPNLRQWVEQHGALSMRTALVLCRELAQALQHAFEVGIAHHESGIIHRDVKPENVLLARNPKAASDDPFPFVVKLADLGLARPSSRGPEQVNLTQHGAAVGTPSTMAPEQYDDPEHVDFRADIYGLGCVLYHALTGTPAFQGPTVSAILTQKLSPFGPDPRKHVPRLPKTVSAFVKRMLARDRALRPASYAELIAELDRLIAASGTAAAGTRRTQIVGIAVGAVALIGLGLWLALREPRATETHDDVARVDPAPQPVAPTDPGPSQPERAEPAKPVDEPPRAILGNLAWDLAAPANPIHVQEGEPVVLEPSLDGTPPVDVVYTWSQAEGGPRVALDGASSRRATFEAPQGERGYTLVFSVHAAAQGVEKDARFEVDVQAQDDPPTAAITPSRTTARDGDLIVLTAAASDPEGQADLSYTWRSLTNTPAIRLLGEHEKSARFLAPQAETSYDAEIELSVRDGRSATIETVIVPVVVDPALAPLAPGTVLELFPREETTFSEHWLADEPLETFDVSPEQNDHVVQAAAPRGELTLLCRKSFALPRGKWRLGGSFQLRRINKDEPLDAGIELDAGLEAFALRLVRSQAGVHVDISKQAHAADGAPSAERETLAKDPGSWKLGDTLAFVIRWDGRSLDVAHLVVPAHEGPAESGAIAAEAGTHTVWPRTVIPCDVAPRHLTLFVRGRQAFFQNFVLEGL